MDMQGLDGRFGLLPGWEKLTPTPRFGCCVSFPVHPVGFPVPEHIPEQMDATNWENKSVRNSVKI